MSIHPDYDKHNAAWRRTLGPSVSEDLVHEKTLAQIEWQEKNRLQPEISAPGIPVADLSAPRPEVKVVHHPHLIPLQWAIAILLLLILLAITAPLAHCQFSKINTIQTQNAGSNLTTHASPFTVNCVGVPCSDNGSTLNIGQTLAPSGGDMTAALQALLNQATSSNYVKIQLGAGTYNFTSTQSSCGPLMTGQVCIPQINQPSTLTTPFTVVEIDCVELPSINFSGVSPQGGTILLTNASCNTCNFIAGSGSNAGGNTQFTNVFFVMKNCILRSYDNPNVTMLNLLDVAQTHIESGVCDTGVQVASISLPTHSNGRCVVYPDNGNSAYSVGRDLRLYGYFSLVQGAEHTRLYNVGGGYAVNGLVACSNSAGNVLGHSIVGDINFEQTQNPIAACTSSQGGVLDIDLDTEQDAGTFQTVADISDSGNQLFGMVRINKNVGTGALVQPIISGASNLQVCQLFSGASVTTASSGFCTQPNAKLGNIAPWTLGTIQAPTPGVPWPDVMSSWTGQTFTATLPASTTISSLKQWGITTAAVPNFTGRTYNVCEFSTIPSGYSGGPNVFVYKDVNNDFSVFLFQGTLFFQRNIAGGGATNIGTLTYVPASHKCVQISESTRVINFKVSSDGVTYTSPAMTTGANNFACGNPITTNCWDYTTGTNLSMEVEGLANTPAIGAGYVQFTPEIQ